MNKINNKKTSLDDTKILFSLKKISRIEDDIKLETY